MISSDGKKILSRAGIKNIFGDKGIFFGDA